MISFGIKYWPAVLLAILAATTGIVILLYFRNKENKELTKVQVRILVALRFLSVFLISFLLLSPFLQSLKKIIKNPIIITAWDNSTSIISTPDSVQMIAEINRIKDDLSKNLANDFSIITYSFGEKTSIAGKLDFNQKKSDYSELISMVNNNHFNENIGALIIAGDGIFNQGKNPVNLLDEINFPVYTIGLGDTTELIDSRIENIRVNRTAFSGNRFPVEIDVHCLKLKEENLKLSVKNGAKKLGETIITPPNDDYFSSNQFIIEAVNPGLKHYEVTIESVKNERNTNNNNSEFVINILENKQKVVILSEGSHPDIGAIKHTLESQKTYDVSVFTEEPFPANLDDFNLIILNQLPTRGKSASEIIKSAKSKRIPILFLVGNKTYLPQLNKLNQGITITPLAGSGEEAQATLNPTYGTFGLSEKFIETLPSLPPLQVAFADYELEAGFNPLLYQKLKNIETGKPLIATGVLNGRKTGFIFGEGIWRWRLFNYYQQQQQTEFNEIINQLIQYLALRENEDNFIINFTPVYAEIDDIILTAEIYDDAYKPVKSAEISIEMQNEEGEIFNFIFDSQGENYRLNAGLLPTGDYNFNAEVNIGNETFRETGDFTIVPVNFESIVTQANHQSLYQLAVQSGGKFYLPNQEKQLTKHLKSNNNLKPSVYFQEMINEFLNFRWLFFVLLLLLSTEWFLRKFWGIY